MGALVCCECEMIDISRLDVNDQELTRGRLVEVGRRGALGFIASGIGALLGGCNLFGVTIRYRLTVEVETRDGLRTGSGVRQATIQPNYAPGYAVSYSARGEAIVIDLPGGPIFILRNNRQNADYSARILSLRAAEVGRSLGISDQDWRAKWAALKRDRTPWVLPRWIQPAVAARPPSDGYPTIVEFEDLRKPRSVRLIDPDGFRGGFKIKRIVAQVTDEPITVGLTKRLPWLKTLQGGLDGSRSIITGVLASEIRTGSFTTER